ncbi:MAG: outer membrane protein assembly factor BamA [Deltaproteobacteria bacterium]|nr:outer membrane protein assembly factor BamA [Deltaproteobacteria bacterium]
MIRFAGFACALAVFLASPLPAGAQDAPLDAPAVAEVRFEGLSRIDRETALKHVTSKPGQPLDRERISTDIRKLFAIGAFEDVQAVAKPTPEGGIALVFRVKERPAVDAILVEGNDEVDEEEIRKKITIRTASILDVKKVESSADAIREHYVEQGFFLAEVDWRLNAKPDNLVDVVFVVREHAKVKVRSVEFVGNHKVAAADIKTIMATQEGTLLGFLTGKGMFSRELFEEDIRRIEFFYNTKGYAEAKVDPPVVMLSRDRQFITVSITVHEGEQYTVGKVTIEAPPGEELLFPVEDLRKTLALKPGELFNALHVQRDDMTLGDMYKDLGYAFATVSNPHVLHREQRLIDFTYLLQKGEKARFGRIDIIGNDGTRDWTIRRELRVFEGDLYSETKLRESEARIKRLGFFEKVEIRPKPGRTMTEVDLAVEVKERQTGAFTVGAGISSIENFMFQAQVSKQNFLGRGQNLSLQATLSSLRTIFMLSFEEPYFLDTDFTFAMDLYNYEILFFNFTRATKGLDVTFGRRRSHELKLPSPWEIGLSVTYKVEGVDVSTGGQKGVSDIPVAYLTQSGITSSIMGTAWFDSRDDKMFPTKGNLSSASLEWAGAGIGSDFQYMRAKVKSKQYFPLILGSVLKISGEFGWIGNPGGSQAVPLFERFFVGGIFTIRGFERYSLGPTIPTGSARDPGAYLYPFNIGGNKQLLFTSEIEFPIFTPIGIRGVVFFDAGNAFDDDESINIIDLRTSAGFGIRWWSPIGPLRFEWGFPLKPHPGEPPMVFEFNIGTF